MKYGAEGRGGGGRDFTGHKNYWMENVELTKYLGR